MFGCYVLAEMFLKVTGKFKTRLAPDDLQYGVKEVHFFKNGRSRAAAILSFVRDLSFVIKNCTS